MMIGHGQMSFILNQIKCGVAFSDHLLLSDNLVPRVLLGGNGDLVKVMEGMTQNI